MPYYCWNIAPAPDIRSPIIHLANSGVRVNNGAAYGGLYHGKVAEITAGQLRDGDQRLLDPRFNQAAASSSFSGRSSYNKVSGDYYTDLSNRCADL